jgi:hypothetical protein
MPARSTTTGAPPRRGGHGSPGMLLLLGLLLLGFAVLVITLQTQTNEAYISGTQHVENILQAEWSIWLQIPKLMFGKAIPGPDVSPNDLPGIIIGQGIELAYIALIGGLEIAMHTSQKMGRFVGAIAIILLILISIFDFSTDLIYGNVSPQAHIVFAIFCTFVVGFFPTWGITLIEHGWKRA